MTERLVINFHGIGEPPPWADADERRSWCSERSFLAVLDRIPQVSAQWRLPIELSFDDGNASDLLVAAPALLRRGLRASFFVCAGRIGRTGYLDAAQLRELAAAGMAVGSHGWDHVDWRRLATPAALQHEVQDSRDAIAQALGGTPVDAVAIPFGSYDRRVARAAAQAYAVVYTSDGGRAGRSGTLVPRESYTENWDADSLRRLAAPPPLLTVLRRRLARAVKRHRGAPA
jgi:peptidoglycan/xylan/chitin deacetylase (PgdA/CDA1 family)